MQGLDVAAQQARKTRITLARSSGEEFASLVLRDERTQRRIKMAPIHQAFHRLMDEHARLIILSHVEAGKTSHCSVARPVFEVGQDPTIRAAVVSNTREQAAKITRTHAQLIEKSPDVHSIFPHLLPDSPWTTTALTVKRPAGIKDPSIQAFGLHGPVQGSRLDRLYLDDPLDWECTRSERAMQDTYDWFKNALESRLTARARVCIVGNAFHPRDLLHRLAGEPGWKMVRFPVRDEAGRLSWPEVWTEDRIALAEERLGPLEAERLLYCRARDVGAQRFQRDWIDACKARGDGRKLRASLDVVPPGCRVFTGVDLGVKLEEKNDRTSFFTIMVHENEDREVLGVDVGRFPPDVIIKKIVQHHRAYQSTMVVENVAAQDYIVQLVRGIAAVPIIAYTTGKSKADPVFGLEKVAVEMSNGKWIIPSQGGKIIVKALQEWESEMLFYSPDAHTGDILMSSWLAVEGDRISRRKERPKVALRIFG